MPLSARRVGRPRKLTHDEATPTLLSRESVVDAAYELCDTTRLVDLTLNQVAAALAVSTTTVRHHIKTRRSLTKLLVDRYFRDLRRALPALTGYWEIDFDNYLVAQAAINARKPGFPAYFFEHRFEPEIEPFGTEDARFVSRHMLRILRDAGLNPRKAAIVWHMVMHLVLSTGYAAARGLVPADRTAVFERIGSALADDSEDRAIIAEMGSVDLAMIYGILSTLVKQAIARQLDFSEEASRFAREAGAPRGRQLAAGTPKLRAGRRTR